jgi:uncharacterized protein YutE (UPF0331/DUF86 family)
VFSVVRAARVATQRSGKHISAAMNQHAAIEEAVFSMVRALVLLRNVAVNISLQQ